VIATGFRETEINPSKQEARPFAPNKKPNVATKREVKKEEPTHDITSRALQQAEDTLDIPTFLRNRKRR
jgi:cell division protein FtsZ